MIFANFKLKSFALEVTFAVALAAILFDRFRFGEE